MLNKEETIRWTVLATAGLCWGVSLTLSWLIIAKVIDQVAHPGLGLVVFMAQGLAITLTVVWAQMRARRTLVEVLRVGMTAHKEEDKG